MKDIYGILESTIVSEKSTFLNTSFGKMVFYASSLSVTKRDIERCFAVVFPEKRVKSINSLITSQKEKRFKGKKFLSHKRKKFIVTVFEVTEEGKK